MLLSHLLSSVIEDQTSTKCVHPLHQHPFQHSFRHHYLFHYFFLLFFLFFLFLLPFPLVPPFLLFFLLLLLFLLLLFTERHECLAPGSQGRACRRDRRTPQKRGSHRLCHQGTISVPFHSPWQHNTSLSLVFTTF